MIYVDLNDVDFENELLDIVKLFFEPGSICTHAMDPMHSGNGIFLSGKILTSNEKYFYHLELQHDDQSASSAIDTGTGIPAREQTAERKAFRWEVKRKLYFLLSGALGMRQPWGMLTGIRPAKIVHELLDEGLMENVIAEKLENYYGIDPAKAKLLIGVAAAEKKILEGTPRNRISLYIGIPFCLSRCVYCSFPSNLISKHAGEVTPYLDALKQELAGTAKLIEARREQIQSIYIGGGTPTSISSEELKELLYFIEDTLDLSMVEEFTLEAGRPDSIDRDKLTAIRGSAVDRISINPQTMNAQTLMKIGRNHSPADIVDKFQIARELGFRNINMDVIVGLPDETPDMFEHTLEELSRLAPESLTVHTLAMKRASRLNEEREAYDFSGTDAVTEMIRLAASYAGDMDMHPYYLYRQKNMLGNLENIGYCKPGSESIYNVQIMEERQTILAVGAGAISKVYFQEENRLERAFNVKDVGHYISRVEEMLERKKSLLFQ